MNHDLHSATVKERPHALVWIDSHEAIVVRWEDDQARIERVQSDVPDHHAATGHVHHDPAIRHSGGQAQDVEESRRNEYMARFIKDVAHRVPGDVDLTVLGPGEAHEHLVKAVRASDVEHRHARKVAGRRSSRKTDRQLVAMLRELEGEEAPRRASGEEHPSQSRRAEVVR